MTDESSSLPVFAGIGPSLYLELPAIVAGSLSGGAHAVRKGFDAVGIVVLAIATGLGGGLMRDIILGHLPPLALVKPVYLVVAMLSAGITFFAAREVARLDATLVFVDAVALGFFGTVGAQQALAARLPLASVLVMGVLTAIGGGVFRDMLSNDVPSILAPGTLYASVAGVGVLIYIAIVVWLEAPRPWAEASAIGVTLILRKLAIWRDWRGPMPLRRPHDPHHLE